MSLWLLGGHDPTHGAGLYRDLVTAKQVAPGLPRYFAVTARTEQGTGRPARAWPVDATRLLARVRRWPAPSAIKVGLVPHELVDTIVALVGATGAPLVVDPVLRASDGGALGSTPTGLRALLRRATLITPNRDEALALASTSLLEGERLAEAVAREFPGVAVLAKDGHGTDPQVVRDRLLVDGRSIVIERPRVTGPDPRGTGCALATAIAAGLARGTALVQAVRESVDWLDRERANWTIGPDGRPHLPDARDRGGRFGPY